MGKFLTFDFWGGDCREVTAVEQEKEQDIASTNSFGGLIDESQIVEAD